MVRRTAWSAILVVAVMLSSAAWAQTASPTRNLTPTPTPKPDALSTELVAVGPFPSGSSCPSGVAVGDLDEDGNPDVAVSNLDGNVSILWGDGSGSLSAPAVWDSSIFQGVAVDDIDGDGHQDIIAWSGEQVAIFWGGGGRMPNGQQVLTEGFYGADAVALADVDGDGDIDVVATEISDNMIEVFYNDGNRTFHSARFPAGLCSTGQYGCSGAVAIGRLKAMGQRDVVVTTPWGVFVLSNDGMGGFGVSLPVWVFAVSPPSAVTIGEFTGDSLPDILLISLRRWANGLPEGISILAGDGAGGFSRWPPLAAGEGPSAVARGDLNRDGRDDVVVTNFISNSISVFLGRVEGGLDSFVPLPVGRGPSAVALGDLNHDDRPDIVTANSQSGSVSVRLNFIPTNTPTPTPTVQVECTPPLCQPGEVFYCPGECPGGCGTQCATPTPTCPPLPPFVCLPEYDKVCTSENGCTTCQCVLRATPTPTPVPGECGSVCDGRPCSGFLIRSGTCQPNGDQCVCVPNTPAPGECALACDGRPCVGQCPDGSAASGYCTYLTVDTGCDCALACSTPTPTPTPTAPCHLIVGLMDCNTDTDCVVVNQIDCCPCSSGGHQAAINGSKQDDLTQYLEVCCAVAGLCLPVYQCEDNLAPVCKSSTCTLVNIAGTPTPTPTPPTSTCAGDCNGDGRVTVDELLKLINFNLDLIIEPPLECPHGLPDGDVVDITFIIKAVNNALTSCPGAPLTPQIECTINSIITLAQCSVGSVQPDPDLCAAVQAACCQNLDRDLPPWPIDLCFVPTPTPPS